MEEVLMLIDMEFRQTAIQSITTEIGCYALCDLDGVPIYVGQSVDGLKERVSRHLAATSSHVIANRLIDVWEIAWVRLYVVKERRELNALETLLYHTMNEKSPLVNVITTPRPEKVLEMPNPTGVVQVMADVEIEEKKNLVVRLARQTKQYFDLVDYYLTNKQSDKIKIAISSHFIRLQRLNNRFLGIDTEVSIKFGTEPTNLEMYFE